MSTAPVITNESTGHKGVVISDTPTVRVALVTGAAQGIGREIALKLAHDGLDIALNDILSNLENLQSVYDAISGQTGAAESTRRCVIVPGDVSKEDDVVGIVEKTVKELGGLDVVGDSLLHSDNTDSLKGRWLPMPGLSSFNP